MSENPSTPEPEQPEPAEADDAEAVFSTEDLEQVLIAGKDGEAQPADIVRAFLTSTVHFLSPTEVSEDTQSVNPLTVQDSEGNPLIVLFSNTDHIPEEYTEHAPHAVEAPGVALVQSISGAGLIIDAGQDHGFQISAEGVERIRTDFLEAADGGA